MEITEIKVFPLKEEKLRAFVSIVFDDCFMVNDIKVIQGRDGLFISMPSRRKRNGKFKDVAHPLNNETRQAIERQILAEFERSTDTGEGEAGADGREHRVASGGEILGSSSPKAKASAQAEAKQEETEDKTLEEIAELHLRDSFWTT